MGTFGNPVCLLEEARLREAQPREVSRGRDGVRCFLALLLGCLLLGVLLLLLRWLDTLGVLSVLMLARPLLTGVFFTLLLISFVGSEMIHS